MSRKSPLSQAILMIAMLVPFVLLWAMAVAGEKTVGPWVYLICIPASLLGWGAVLPARRRF